MSKSLWKYIARRIAGLVPVIFIIVTITFFLMRIAPGGPFDRDKNLPKDVQENVNRLYGLDKPVLVQYWNYLKGVVHGDLGYSFGYPDKTVSSIILNAFPASLELGIVALIFALISGVFIGVISAVRKGKFLDWLFFSFTVLGVSIPSIVLAPLLILVFGVWLKILPVAGWGGPKEMVLPVITLSIIYVSFIARLTRASVIEVLNRDYVKAARSVGIAGFKLLWKYVLKGSLLPVVSYLGPAFAGIVTGSLVIERVFLIPGLGSHFVQAALNRDYTLAMGTVIFYSVILLVANLVVDIVYLFIDPRIGSE